MGAEHRRAPRRQVAQPALMMGHDGAVIGPCLIVDVSAGGARLKLPLDMTVPDTFVLLLSKFDARMTRQCVVAWRDEKKLGVRFLPGGA